jgi:Zn-dependent peptidase ImmA (M78 family)
VEEPLLAANAFAAELLMPAGLISHDHLDTGLTVARLAARYKVSSEAMGIRLSVLGLA